MALPEVETDSTVAFGDEYFISGDKNKQPALDALRDRFESGEISEEEAKATREAIRRSPSGKSAADYLGDISAFLFGASGEVSGRDAKIAEEDAAAEAEKLRLDQEAKANFTGAAPVSAEYSDDGQKVTMHVPAAPTKTVDPMNPEDNRTPPHIEEGGEPLETYQVVSDLSLQRPDDREDDVHWDYANTAEGLTDPKYWLLRGMYLSKDDGGGRIPEEKIQEYLDGGYHVPTWEEAEEGELIRQYIGPGSSMGGQGHDMTVAEWRAPQETVSTDMPGTEDAQRKFYDANYKGGYEKWIADNEKWEAKALRWENNNRASVSAGNGHLEPPLQLEEQDKLWVDGADRYFKEGE
jgi:hypothetical protein